MKLVRVHNPGRIVVARKRKGTKKMAARRRLKRRGRSSYDTARVARARASRASNPRRRRRHSRRRNPTIVARTTRRRHARATNPRRRRRHSRRRNPSALRIGQIAKDMIYGAGGAILTRTGTSLISGFVPGALTGSPFVDPVLQAAVAVIPVRWLGKRFLGQTQGDIMMLGGLISAGLSFADKFLPNIQGQLTSVIRTPIQTAPQAAIQPVNGAGLGDVYDVDMTAAGFGALGDVYDVDNEMFQ